jgi:hypothetical protein
MRAELEEESFSDWLDLDSDFDARTSGRQIGSWDNFENDRPSGSGQGPRWQGGAASARRSDGDASGRSRRAPRNAALSLGDRDLVNHDIWFVLTGASEADHAGMEEFLSAYHDKIRGAHVVNLECVGVGEPTLVVEEGGRQPAKADRRLVNLIGSAASSINRPLALGRLPWRDSDGAVALRRGMRAVSIMGIRKGVPASARSLDDTPEKVNTDQVNDVVDILVEVIKSE